MADEKLINDVEYELQELASQEPVLKYFKFRHLRPAQMLMSEQFAIVVLSVMTLPPSLERTKALDRLLEAKDAAVRASLEQLETEAAQKKEEPRVTTIYGTPPERIREVQQNTSGQHADYLILSKEERDKGFVRPVRRSYRHVGCPGPKYTLRDLTEEEKERYSQYGYIKFEAYLGGEGLGRFWTEKALCSADKGCGQVTTMGIDLAETYARDPGFYGSTYCSTCARHLPVGPAGEFVWEGTTERVGT